MILDENEDGVPFEIQCDICKVTFDDIDELREFINFNFKMGARSVCPNKQVTFNCCQDCFINAFPEIFEIDLEE